MLRNFQGSCCSLLSLFLASNHLQQSRNPGHQSLQLIKTSPLLCTEKANSSRLAGEAWSLDRSMVSIGRKHFNSAAPQEEAAPIIFFVPPTAMACLRPEASKTCSWLFHPTV